MDDYTQIKADMHELKINVKTIREEIAAMKQGVSDTMAKMTDALILLATITEKMNSNFDEHKVLHRRLDSTEHSLELIRNDIDNNVYEDIRRLENKINDLSHKTYELEVRHNNCLDSKRREEAEEKNTIVSKLKSVVVEWAGIGVIALLLYMFYTHAKDFFVFINGGK